MNIIALVKQTPDTAKLSRTLNGVQLMADGQPRIVNPWDEYTLETALQLKEKHGGKKVTAIALGKPEAVDALRTALAMGADEAALVSDPVLAQADVSMTAKALTAAIRKAGGADLIVAGRAAIDGNGGAVGAQVAALLGLPMLSYVAKLNSVAAGRVSAVRALEHGRETVSTSLPAVISVLKEIAEPRYPSFMGIRKAAKVVIPTWSLGDLGLAGLQPRVTWQTELPVARETQVTWIKGSPEEMARALVSSLQEAKVL
jgi:electron transfer flavoprotein beta subunit